MKIDTTQQKGQDLSPSQVAAKLGMGFVYHDKRKRKQAISAFATVDTVQFSHLSSETARKASIAYVDALWEKDNVEKACTVDGELDEEALDETDWTPVQEAFEQRASIVGMNHRYAKLSTIAWRRHKTGGDYWSPMQEAQKYELRAALQDDSYPRKPRDGQSGHGPEAARYVLGVELHDMRRFEEGIEAMTPYFDRILQSHRNEPNREWSV